MKEFIKREWLVLLMFLLIIGDMVSTELILKQDGMRESNAFIELVHFKIGFIGLVIWAALVSVLFMWLRHGAERLNMRIQIECVMCVYLFATIAAIMNNISLYILNMG